MHVSRARSNSPQRSSRSSNCLSYAKLSIYNGAFANSRNRSITYPSHVAPRISWRGEAYKMNLRACSHKHVTLRKRLSFHLSAWEAQARRNLLSNTVDFEKSSRIFEGFSG